MNYNNVTYYNNYNNNRPFVRYMKSAAVINYPLEPLFRRTFDIIELFKPTLTFSLALLSPIPCMFITFYKLQTP